MADREEKRNNAKDQGEKYIEDTSDKYCSKKYISHIDDVTRELLIWAVLSGREDKIKQIIEAEKRPLKVISNFSIIRISGLLINYCSEHSPTFKLFIAVAVMCNKCAPLCKEYGLNGKKSEYEEWAQEYENKATEVRSRFLIGCGLINDLSSLVKYLKKMAS